MPGHSLPDYQCGELRVTPALGLVSNGRGESVRLGLVNMKVLCNLLAQPGRMVSRGEIFEAVWPNQVVSDDALTRCVSDIRGQLRKLSGRDEWIETLPKRGYRWIGPVAETAPVAVVPGEAASPAVVPATSVPSARRRHALVWLLGRGVAYLVALVVMGSIVVWAIDRWSEPRNPIIAVLPVTSDPALTSMATELDRDLRSWLGQQKPIRVLARSAIDARPANPFPYFHYEFGARWLVEAGLQEASGQMIVSIAIADARTGLVEMQHSERVAGSTSGRQWLSDEARRALEEFFESQLDH